jgi:UDP-N-acetylmuramoyl-tripeptide--D-alanyl-D-alanine ligase
LEAGNLFVALHGEIFDGSDYLDTATKRGASGLLVNTASQDKLLSMPETTPTIGVADTLLAYGALARRWRDNFDVPVVAITGSSGKTTAKEMIAAIASLKMNVLKTEGNLNNQVGLPVTLFKLRKEHQVAVVEMGTNSPGEIAKLAAIARPNIGLITNIGPAHLEGLGSMEAIAAEKGSLWGRMNGYGTAIVNNDDQYLASFALRWGGRKISFGLGDGADVTARNLEPSGEEGIRFDLVIGGASIPVFLAAPGRHNVKNAIAAAAVATVLGISIKEIAAGLASFHPISGRTEIRKLSNGAHLIIDTYNANPYSVAEALKTLQELQKTGSAIAILGDMLELGKEAEKWHREIGTVISKGTVDSLFLKGELITYLADGAIKGGFPKESITFFEKPEEIVSCLRDKLKKGDWILLKGSRKMKMETVATEIIKAVDQQTQTSWHRGT